MPTTRPRHQVTETPDVARALDLAEERWPGETRSRLLLRLVRAGGAVLEGEHSEDVQRRLAAIDGTRGRYADIFTSDYLLELREDWPE